MIDPQDRINYASQYLKWHEMKRIADDSYNRVAIAAIQDVVIESHLSQDQRDILLRAMEALGATGSDYLTICRRLVNGTKR